MSSSEGVASNEVSTSGITDAGTLEFIETNTYEIDENNTNEINEVASIIAELKMIDELASHQAHDRPSSVSPEQKMSPSKEGMAEATSQSGKTKHATVGIYRPPSLRSGDGASPNETKSKLNVNAREFVMGNEKKTKKNDDDNNSETISPSLRMDVKSLIFPLNISKSNIFSDPLSRSKYFSSQSKTNDERPKNSYDLQRGKSSGNVRLSSENYYTGTEIVSKVHFKPIVSEKGDFHYAEKTSPTKKAFSESLSGLKRSKSLSATTDVFKFETSPTRSFTEYDYFPAKLHRLIRLTVEDPNQMDDKTKIALGRKVVELAVDDGKLAPVAAKLSIMVLDKDKSGAYYDSLVNTCQMLYQSKEISSVFDPTKFAAFLAFLQEFHSELKRRALQLKMSDSVPQRESTFLMLIARCCIDLVDSRSVTEIQCLFSTLTKVGREIENEAPIMFKRLFDTIREILLTGRNPPEVRKVLLQLMELRAFEWQLPLSALNFYYPKVLA